MMYLLLLPHRLGLLLPPPPLSESSSDTEDDAPVIENEALGMPPVERCEKKRKIDNETCSFEIREGKKRMDKMEQGLGDEMQFSNRVEHRVTDLENREQERDEEMVKVKKRLGTLKANYSLVLSDRDEWRRAFLNLQALVFERLGWGAWDARPDYSIDHQEDLNQQRISDVHDRLDKLNESQNELLNMMKSFCEMVIQQKQADNIDQSPPQEMSIQDMDDLKQQYLDEMKSMINQIQIEDYRNERFDIHYRRECEIKIDELRENFIGMSIEINKKKELQQQEQAAKLSTYTPSLRDESYEVIKSSVEDFVPVPSESEDISKSDRRSEDSIQIYSNHLFKFADEYISSDVNPLFDEVLENIENKDSYDSNLDDLDLLVTPLSDANEDECFDPGDDVNKIKLLRDPSTPKMSVDSILERFTNEPPLEENDDLFDLESKENEWKKILYDAPINDLMTEGKLLRDPSTPKMSVDSILERFTNEPPLEENDDLFDLESKENEWKKILYDAPINDLMTEGKVFDFEIWMNFFLQHMIASDYEDSRARGFVHYLLDLQSLACFYMEIQYPRSY
uniref:Uncharacterized protein n=1 Tax=Tanacetum cinerariifolium TaxID=118510 RepID=A0A6L2MCY9_TANCI|nr:hypothetical protein [Tanacetum cinerariifolium]